MSFPWRLNDSKSPRVSRTLHSILVDLNTCNLDRLYSSSDFQFFQPFFQVFGGLLKVRQLLLVSPSSLYFTAFLELKQSPSSFLSYFVLFEIFKSFLICCLSQDCSQYFNRSQHFYSLHVLDSSSDPQFFWFTFHVLGDCSKSISNNRHDRQPHVYQLFQLSDKIQVFVNFSIKFHHTSTIPWHKTFFLSSSGYIVVFPLLSIFSSPFPIIILSIFAINTIVVVVVVVVVVTVFLSLFLPLSSCSHWFPVLFFLFGTP